jgi:hypothetical protein
MPASFKGPSIFGVLLGNVPNSVGEGAAAILFSYGGSLGSVQLVCTLLACKHLVRPIKLGMPPLLSVGRGGPISKLTESNVDLVQEWLDLAGLEGSL